MSIVPTTRVLRIKASVAVDMVELQAQNENVELDDEFISYCASYAVAQVVNRAAVLSELAFPGAITMLEGAVFANGILVNTTEKKRCFLSLDGENAPNWPPLTHLKLAQLDDWALMHGYSKESFAATKLGRALAAFTHALSLTESRGGEVLFRAMQGLEAMYCDGTGDLRRQLSEKIKIWLGEWSDKSNLVGKLYDIRSAFVHGAAYIEFTDHGRDAAQDEPKTKQNSDYATTFAVRLLIASIQRCVESMATELVWRLEVEAKRPN